MRALGHHRHHCCCCCCCCCFQVRPQCLRQCRGYCPPHQPQGQQLVPWLLWHSHRHLWVQVQVQVQVQRQMALLLQQPVRPLRMDFCLFPNQGLQSAPPQAPVAPAYPYRRRCRRRRGPAEEKLAHPGPRLASLRGALQPARPPVEWVPAARPWLFCMLLPAPARTSSPPPSVAATASVHSPRYLLVPLAAAACLRAPSSSLSSPGSLGSTTSLQASLPIRWQAHRAPYTLVRGRRRKLLILHRGWAGTLLFSILGILVLTCIGPIVHAGLQTARLAPFSSFLHATSPIPCNWCCPWPR